ncbi:Rv1678 family membrane protein [Sinomonas sp. P47F7]|uniref:Rv1678 family membrane protein n=1 Tax=Sinomonas sp. P47F7 TaxID=3410987 RepID=UPI003BF54443
MGRATITLGIAAAASTLTALPLGKLQMESLSGVGFLAVLVLAAATVFAGILRLRPLALASGLGFLGVALFELVQLAATDANALGGSLSTVSMQFAFGLGVIAVAAETRKASGARS